jgi:hypothetical protein
MGAWQAAVIQVEALNPKVQDVAIALAQRERADLSRARAVGGDDDAGRVRYAGRCRAMTAARDDEERGED